MTKDMTKVTDNYVITFAHVYKHVIKALETQPLMIALPQETLHYTCDIQIQ